MATTLPCPLCCQPNFTNVNLLRASLISVTNRPLMCPICNEIVLGLDELTAHLSNHIEVPRENCFNDDHHHENNARSITHCSENSSIDSFANVPRLNYVETENAVNHTKTSSSCSENPFKSMTSDELMSSPASMSTAQTQPAQLVQSDRHEQTLHICHLCGSTFRSQQLQQMHMQLVHEIPSNCIDSNSSSTLAESSRVRDAVASSSTMVQCYLCPKQFKMIGSLRLHARMVHGVSRIPQKYNISNQHLGASSNLVHATESNQTELLPGANDREIAKVYVELNTSVSNMSLTSDQTQSFHSLKDACVEDENNVSCHENFNKCVDDKDKVQNDSCSDSNNNNGESCFGATDERTHECDICRKRFTTKYFLKKHKRLHTGEMPYTCEICNRTFTFQQSYHRHLSYHTNERPHNCTICGRAFKELSTLHNHERIHSGEKPFECEMCGKCFRQRVSYLVHRRIHTGVMQYNCIQCDKKFRYKISLKTHKCTRTIATDVPESAVATEAINHQSDDTTLVNDNLQCAQTLDEFIAESCNRMGIVDATESNQTFSDFNSTGEIKCMNSSGLQSHIDTFTFNDLPYTDELPNTDLAHMLPTLNEIFPETMDIMNELYNDNVNSSDLDHLV